MVYGGDGDMNLHTAIDEHAERAQAEIRLLAALAMKHIKRLAEFPARSAGQQRRHSKKEKE